MLFVDYGLRSGVVVTALLAACGSDPDSGGETGSDESSTSATSATTMVADDSGTTTSPDPQTGSDSGSGSGSETGEPVPECPAGDETISAQLSVEIDGTPIIVDYGGAGSVAGIPEDWNPTDDQPEIDGMCDVVQQMADSLTLSCADTDGTDRTFALSLQTTDALSTDVGKEPVHLWYMANVGYDMLRKISDTAAHSMVLSNGGGIVLAGIDGRYAAGAFSAGLDAAWPQWPQASISSNACAGPRDEAHFELESGETLDLADGAIGDLGPYRVIVETAVSVDEFDGEFDRTVPTARWVLGLPQ